MKIKRASLIVTIWVLLSGFSISIMVIPEEAKASIHSVSWTGDMDFAKIKDAIDAASPGDTIFVYNGTYNEQLTISIPLTLIGEDVNTTRIEVINTVANKTSRAIYVTADWVNVSGFTIASKPWPPIPLTETFGLDLIDSQYCRIENNRFQTNRIGAYLWRSSHNYVANNTLTSNEDGFLFINSEQNLIINNTAFSNYQDGFRLMSSSENAIVGNKASGNAGDGFNLFSSYDNMLYHNYAFGNSRQASDDGENCWDGCYPAGGNYWWNYAGVDDNQGPDQDQPGSDGFGDTPYPIPGAKNEDRYPLMSPTFLPTVPSPPLELQAEAGNGVANLSWDSPIFDGSSTITNYSVYRKNASEGEVLLATLGTVFEYADSGLMNGETYQYHVSAINAEGEGCESKEVLVTPATVPGPPLSLIAQPGIEKITLTWFPPVDNGGSTLTNYILYRGTASGGETHLVTLGNVSLYDDLGLTSGQDYYYRVSAVNSIGEGQLSNEASANPFSPPPNEPPTCSIDSPLSGSVAYGINQISGQAYDSDGSIEKVEIRIDNGSWTQVLGTSLWTYDWNTSQVPDGQHKIYARSFDGEDYSNVANVTVIVENSAPSDDTEIPIWWSLLYLIFALLAILILLVVFFIRRGMKKREKGVQSDSPSREVEEREKQAR